MIRPMTPDDLDAVAALWLTCNLDAHAFIAPSYWHTHLPAVREQLAQAEIYVCVHDGQLVGFAGLQDTLLAGLFVAPAQRSRGWGAQLLHQTQAVRDRLTLYVYARNVRALRFYQREGFSITRSSIDPDTGQTEYQMDWRR